MNPSPAAPLFWLDVFTAEPMAGNPLAVVLEADAVPEPAMLDFAREVGLSETTFVQSAGDPGADYLNRIWTIAAEIPFAGHPSLGTAVAVAIDSEVEEATYIQQTQVGRHSVDVKVAESSGGLLWQASMLQEPARFAETVPADRVAAALGLAPDRMHASLSCQKVSTGLPALLAPLESREALMACRPDFGALRKIDESRALNLYAFHLDVPARHILARCFAADMGEVEDPATGSAAGPLVAYLQDCLDIDRVTIDQGVEMGRPSRIEAVMEAGRPRISGEVRLLSRGLVYLP